MKVKFKEEKGNVIYACPRLEEVPKGCGRNKKEEREERGGTLRERYLCHSSRPFCT